MGKTAKRKKKRRQAEQLQRSQLQRRKLQQPNALDVHENQTTTGSSQNRHLVKCNSPSSPILGAHVGGVRKDDLGACIRVLSALRNQPMLLSSHPMKPVRIALHSFFQSECWQSNMTTAGKSLSGRIADALRDGRLEDAYRFLSDMKLKGQKPKVGSLQRWVRDCDAAGGTMEASAARERLVFLVLDAMLRLAAPHRIASAVQDTLDDKSMTIEIEGRLRRYPNWVIAEVKKPDLQALHSSSTLAPSNSRDTEEKKDAVPLAISSNSISEPDQEEHTQELKNPESLVVEKSEKETKDEHQEEKKIEETNSLVKEEKREGLKFREVAREVGADRRPPNLHDLVIYASKENAVKLESGIKVRDRVQRIDVPFVSGAFVMRNVLSAAECATIVTAAESVGYSPDEPCNGSRSVLAHNFVWLVDNGLLDEVFARVRPHLPPLVDGCKVAGINANWRLFRYQPGAIYRPHIDGSWPGSGLVDGEWKFDAYGDRWSRLTFLLYLTDDFEGGCTTFFTPSSKNGMLNARGVKPERGSVLCFPHGRSNEALLHEGSGLIRGTKYIVRSDVLYYKI